MCAHCGLHLCIGLYLSFVNFIEFSGRKKQNHIIWLIWIHELPHSVNNLHGLCYQFIEKVLLSLLKSKYLPFESVLSNHWVTIKANTRNIPRKKATQVKVFFIHVTIYIIDSYRHCFANFDFHFDCSNKKKTPFQILNVIIIVNKWNRSKTTHKSSRIQLKSFQFRLVSFKLNNERRDLWNWINSEWWFDWPHNWSVSEIWYTLEWHDNHTTKINYAFDSIE